MTALQNAPPGLEIQIYGSPSRPCSDDDQCVPGVFLVSVPSPVPPLVLRYPDTRCAGFHHLLSQLACPVKVFRRPTRRAAPDQVPLLYR